MLTLKRVRNVPMKKRNTKLTGTSRTAHCLTLLPTDEFHFLGLGSG